MYILRSSSPASMQPFFPAIRGRRNLTKLRGSPMAMPQTHPRGAAPLLPDPSPLLPAMRKSLCISTHRRTAFIPVDQHSPGLQASEDNVIFQLCCQCFRLLSAAFISPAGALHNESKDRSTYDHSDLKAFSYENPPRQPYHTPGRRRKRLDMFPTRAKDSRR